MDGSYFVFQLQGAESAGPGDQEQGPGTNSRGSLRINDQNLFRTTNMEEYYVCLLSRDSFTS